MRFWIFYRKGTIQIIIIIIIFIIIFFLNSMPTFEFLASWDIYLTMTEEKYISSYSVYVETLF